MDKLEEVFRMQEALNREIDSLRHLEGIGREEWLQRLTLATLSELAEMLDGVNFKWWKNPKDVDEDYVKEEIVDLFHFFVSMALRSGMDAQELFSRYVRKNQENFDRQHGKSRKPGYDVHEMEGET
ncbi:MAG TPA: dUTP diphosphatase [Candidatus Pullichristensenella excrementigallinarum]|uniref:dUTP diphosphatase n=1 Tax=Candidatus Pullichristensenella excrementigallinarum TaxID=2840907 RepID=A0A9D1ICE1_9FIRM|nr:dUTP diphosphatase [Candidatus Pullichristensenella excrementigallinarum]